MGTIYPETPLSGHEKPNLPSQFVRSFGQDRGQFGHFGPLAIAGTSARGFPGYRYPVRDAYFAYASRGCIRKCHFCGVPKLEGAQRDATPLTQFVQSIDQLYGAKRDLILMDNNVVASARFKEIIAEIRDLGFTPGAKLKRDHERVPSQRRVDFNQGVDARILCKDPMYLRELASICLSPLRIAFDHLGLKGPYERAIRYARELADHRANAVRHRAQLERDLAETEGRLNRQLDLYETNVITREKLKERIDGLETRAAAIRNELAASEVPTTYTVHPRAVDLYREIVGRLHSALADDDAQAAREAFRGLLDGVTFIPGNGKGQFQLELHGRLAALLEAPNAKTPQAITACGVMVGAGIGFEPMTFRL